MTREIFERKLHHLEDEVLSIGSMVETAFTNVIGTLRSRNLDDAHKIEASDSKINERRFAVEEECITLMATQQPMARDLRILAAILEVITELERMGDYAKGIAHIITMLGPDPIPPDLLDDFDAMGVRAVSMLHRALIAFVAIDEKAARTIPADDDAVDKLYNQIYRALLGLMAAKSEATINHATHLLWVAHNLERFADRVTNICERTVFTATGEITEISSNDGSYRGDAK
jgi:phosphate transport system protein